MSAVIMILSAGAIIGLVRFGLVAGLDQLAGALNWSPKTRGQMTGFATSAPELVVLVAAGLAGVWDAGLWNIASSNIINATLMIAAVARYRKGRDLLTARFIDEIGFAALAIAAPLVLMKLSFDQRWATVPILLGLFVVYRVIDRKVNPGSQERATESVGSVPLGIILALTALILIIVAGFFLGGATEEVVNQLGLHPAIAGWVLGFVTSLPEMVTFFAVYSTAQEEGRLDGLEGTQEVLDNLAASNMANTGLIYPVGLGVYLVTASLIG